MKSIYVCVHTMKLGIAKMGCIFSYFIKNINYLLNRLNWLLNPCNFILLSVFLKIKILVIEFNHYVLKLHILHTTLSLSMVVLNSRD